MSAAGGKKAKMKRISIGLSDLTETHFDVVIVGSGYGGSIAASRLAGAGKKVCLLERGREILPGEYPTTLTDARQEIEMVTARDGPLKPGANAMMQVRINDDVHVVLGNGLGGGSLINAGVSIRPDARVFKHGWPEVYRPDGREGGVATQEYRLAKYYDRVKRNLGAEKLPEHIKLAKLTALEQSAKAMNQNVERADINVTFTEGKNVFNFEQNACNLCGDCCSGCNYKAKNTLLMNYLPDAHRSGATIVTEAEVRTIAPDGAGWKVNVENRAAQPTDHPPSAINADMIVLAAGSLGSTEIVKRSAAADAGFTVSRALGSKFSTNGDVLAFGFGADLPASNGEKGAPTPLYSIGAGSHYPNKPQYQSGPCITGVVRVDMTDDKPLDHGLLIEDGTAPGLFASVYPPMMFMQDVLGGQEFQYPDSMARLDGLKTLGEGIESGGDPAHLSYTGIMAQMQCYLVMSHDDASGKLAYNADTELVYVDWPGAGDAPVYQRDNERLTEASEAIWANFIPNPIWEEGFGRNLVSVHPLGGCPMSDSDQDGVTDADCRLYKGDGRNSVYENFLICDGSVAPTSLGVNPLMTISAITERAMDNLVGDPVTPRAEAPDAPKPAPVEMGEPVAAAEVGETGWPLDTIAWSIQKTRYAICLLALVCIGNTRLQKWIVRWAVPKLMGKLLHGADVTKFSDKFIDKVNLSKDLRPALVTLAHDLKRLAEAITNNKPAPAQPFLRVFFDIFGDVSPGFGFDETMQGHIADAWNPQGFGITDPYEMAEELGKAAKQTLVANFSIKADHTLGHDGKKDIIGQIVGAELTGEVITGVGDDNTTYTVTNGVFDLLLPDPTRVETWLMTYRCELLAPGADAPSWEMVGTKTLRRRDGSFWWKDLTTLFVDLTPLGENAAAKRKQGIIRLDLQDLAKQSTTISAGFDESFTSKALKEDLLAAAENGALAKETKNGKILHKAAATLLGSKRAKVEGYWPYKLALGLEAYFAAGVAATFGKLILRTYGGYIAYMQDYPSLSDGKLKALPKRGELVHGSPREDIWLKNKKGNGQIRMFHFAPPNPETAKGPILLAPGMSTTSLSFALKTIDTSLVERLLADNYDVWLFDSRLSPTVTPIETDYTLDDVASEDWPTAVDHVLANTVVKGPGASTVQILAHCVGALTAQMALLGGFVSKEKVRQMVVMQFTVHPAAAWFNVVKSEVGLAQDFSGGFPPLLASAVHSMVGDGASWDAIEKVLKDGIPSIDPVSPGPTERHYQIPLDQIHNTVDWHAPFGIDHMCYSPTCHRIYGLYGPVIAHDKVNEKTHDAMRQMFGRIATKPFVQLGMIMELGKAVSADGEDIYIPNHKRLEMPFHVISGSVNQIVQPESGFRTIQWLKDAMPESAHLFTRTLIKGYAHNDCFIGNGVNEAVFNGIMDVLKPYENG